MKSNAITRIIIFSIVIVLLLGILLTGLGIGMFIVEFEDHSLTYTTVEDSKAQVAAERITHIDIEWASGNIDILTGDTNDIIVEENGIIPDSQRMVINETANTLTIRYEEPAFQIGFVNTISKDLTVTVPKDWVCDTLSLDVASAKLSVQNFSAEKVDIDTASGACTFSNCAIGELDVDTASGTIRYKGTLQNLNCDAASGSFEGIFANVPQRMDMDSASGNLDITLPEGCGFRVTMDTLSGKFQSDFPTTSDSNSYTYGDARCVIDFDALSGSIRIRKAG